MCTRYVCCCVTANSGRTSCRHKRFSVSTLVPPLVKREAITVESASGGEGQMLGAKLKAFLESCGVQYEIISHSTTYTAQKTAEDLHMRGEELAKSVIVRMDNAFAMAVLSTSQHVDLSALQKAAAANTARLASEIEFKDLFPDCEIGAIPPFGNLYGLAVFVEEDLSRSKNLTFNAGSHSELIRMSYEDFDRLVRPTILKFASRRAHAHAAGLKDRLW